MRVFLLARHGQSELNVRGVVNGDPALDRGLSERGRDEARKLGGQIAAVGIDVCVLTRFPRTHATADLALGTRPVARVIEPLLDDIDIGELEGSTLAAYRAWKRERSRSDPFPGGESLDAAARRYADAFERLLARDETMILVIAHEIPVRYAVNAAAGSDDLDGPTHDVANATPYVFDEWGLARAVARMRELAA